MSDKTAIAPFPGETTAKLIAIRDSLREGAKTFSRNDVQELIDAIDTLSTHLDTQVSETERAERQLREVTDPEIRHLRIENGSIDLHLSGVAVQHMGLVISEHFRASGAKNYLEMGYTAKSEPFERYVWTIQKVEGPNTPHQLRMKAEGELADLRATLSEQPFAWLCNGAGDGWAEHDKITRDPVLTRQYLTQPHHWKVEPLFKGRVIEKSSA